MPIKALSSLVALIFVHISEFRSGVYGSIESGNFDLGESEWLTKTSELLDDFTNSINDPLAAINLDDEMNNHPERQRRQLQTASTPLKYSFPPGKPQFLVSPENPIYILFPVPKDEGKPEVNPFAITIIKIQPVVAEALDEVYRRQLVPYGSLNVTFEDTGTSDAHGPNVAIHALVQNRLDVIIGYAFVYALAPVARMSPHWKDKDSSGIPVITPIGLTSNLDNREEYSLMTRISPPYKVVRNNIVALFKNQTWIRVVYLFHDRRGGTVYRNVPYGECYLTMASIEPSLSKIHKMQHNYYMFDEGSVTKNMLKEFLMKASVISNGPPYSFSTSRLMAVVQWQRRRRSSLSLLQYAILILVLTTVAVVAQHTSFPQRNFSFLSRRALIPRQHVLPYHMLLVLPAKESNNDKFGLTLSKARPVIDIAVEDVVKRGIMPSGWINITYHDSRYWEDNTLAERWSTFGVVEAYCHKRLDVVFGFADSYSVATVSKVSAGFGDGIPIFTTTGLTAQLGSKKDFPYLTRMQGSYRQMADSIYQLIAYKGNNGTAVNEKPINSSNLNCQHLVFMYHDKRRALNKLRRFNDEMVEQVLSSHCYFSLFAIKQYFTEKSEVFKTNWQITTPSVAFDEELSRTTSEVQGWLKTVSTYSNVIILCASPDTVREIMLSAHDLGMATSGEYVFINIDVSTGSHAEKPWIRANDTNSSENEKAKEAYKALKTISLRRSDLDEYKNFESRVKERAEKKYNYSEKTGKEYEMNNFISAFYDAVLLYAIALNETLAEGLDPRNGKNITSKMWNRTFVGITGNVSIDQNGDRYSDYSLLDLDPNQGKFVEVAYYSGANNQLHQMSDFHWVGGSPPKDQPICGWNHSKCYDGPQYMLYLFLVAIVVIITLAIVLIVLYRRYKLESELAAMSWKIPWDELEGDDAERKERKKKRSRKMDFYNHPDQSEALLRSNSRVSITSDKFAEDDLDVLAIRMKLRSSSSGATRKISAMIDRKLSIFTRKKSSPSDKIDNNHSNHYSERNVRSPSISVTTAKKKSSIGDGFDNSIKKIVSINNRKHSFSRYSRGSGGSVETIQMQNNAQIFTTTSTYKGQMVAIKKLAIDPKKIPKLDFSRKLLMEFKAMKDLQHDHITRFAGACVEAPHYCIVTEYCPKGSLEDILENEKIKLDKMMKYSLLHDLVKGMYFLHNSVIRSHGKLKTSNCVVDSRFVLKITDFGLAALHNMEDISGSELEEHSFYKKQLWMAPELLRMENKPFQGTQRGDVYSFALILHEMLYRRGAFYRGENESPSPKEIVNNVSTVPANEDRWYRPIIPEMSPVDDNPETVKKLIDLMVNCWAEYPHDRPEFNVIRKIVHSLNKDNETSNLVDNLLKRMEQYATNLEGLVEERTQEYLAEKKKVEDLLHQLLPPTVADQLIAGHAVQAESYDWVTIYFSDIVGFTALSSKSTPMQVVTLLNDLYLAFDSVVDNFKVYKVETIGDAYMVVSGLPERREDHASQIAQMSLALLQKVKNFVIRHRPSEQLKLRIGMHSGSVVAGVVGSKMPRYTLFGDCVNTSSRMESNGLPLRIHVSKVTKEILSKDPDFHLELRGQIEMKGKGLQTTYWLKSYKDTVVPDFGPEFR